MCSITDLIIHTTGDLSQAIFSQKDRKTFQPCLETYPAQSLIKSRHMADKKKLPKVVPLLSPAAALVSPSQRVMLYSAAEWEEFIREWMEGFDPAYALVDRLGGPGDLGRDVVGYVNGLNTGRKIESRF